MKDYEAAINHCLLNDTESSSGDSDRYTAINLRDDLQEYHTTYASEIIVVDGILSSCVAEEDKTETAKAAVSLIDINDDNALNDNYHQLIVAIDKDECIIHKTDPTTLQGNASHYFYIQEDNETSITSLSVTVVHTGTHIGSDYTPSILSVQLNQYIDGGAMQIGRSPSKIQHINTRSEIGCVVIEHEIEIESKLMSGSTLFEVQIAVETKANYSITLGACFACPLVKEIKRRLARVIATRKEIRTCVEKMESMEQNLALLERKRVLEEKLMNQSKDQSKRCSLEMASLDLKLDYQDDMVDGGTSIVEQINKLKLQHEESCRLFSVR